MRTHSCDPTLNDHQVLDFCKNGYLILEGVVPDDINTRSFEFLEGQTFYEPTEILHEPWFVDHVILNPAAAGAVRSLLGDHFGLPDLMSNHRRTGTQQHAGGWHRDGYSKHGPELAYLQVFYYPQDTPVEMGPTEVLPGSHRLFSQAPLMAHYGRLAGTASTTAPAGTIFITDYAVWHRATAKPSPATRNLLKYNYWRTVAPKRDWIIDPAFDMKTVDYSFNGRRLGVQFQDAIDNAEMFFWLCGKHHEFRIIGGQGWPLPAHRMSPAMGYPGERLAWE